MTQENITKQYYVSNTDLAIIAKLLFWSDNSPVELPIRNLHINSFQQKKYCEHINNNYSFLQAQVSNNRVITINTRNIEEGKSWLKQYLKNLGNNNLSYEYALNRPNPDSFKTKLRNFYQSIDRTKSPTSYRIVGTKYFDVVLFLHLYKQDKSLVIKNVDISAYLEEYHNCIYDTVFVPEADEEYEILTESYLDVKVTMDLQHIDSLPLTPNSTNTSLQEQTSDKLFNKLTDEEISIMSARKYLVAKGEKATYKKIGQLLAPQLSENNVKQKVNNIKNKIGCESLLDTINELESKGFFIPPFKQKL